jgi:hypothetical protein
MHYGELITDDIAFSALRTECNEVFDTNQRLPGKVFRPNFAKYYAFEHSQIFRKDFASFLTNVARVFADSSVNYMTLDPDPVEYYRKNCGFYGLASFKPVNLMDSYLKVMSREGNADSFRARGGDVGVLWGSSLNWGIFCDRRSWDVCLMGTSFELDHSILNEVGCMDADRLKLYLLHQYQNRHVVAVEFLKKLDMTYPTLRYQH